VKAREMRRNTAEKPTERKDEKADDETAAIFIK